MTKPHIARLDGVWYCFSSCETVDGNGDSPEDAYIDCMRNAYALSYYYRDLADSMNPL